MLRLNELNVETLQFLNAEQRDPVLFTSRRCSKVMQRHQFLMSLRNINMEVEYLEPRQRIRYRLTYAPTNLLEREFDHEHPLFYGEEEHRDATVVKRRLEPYLRGCWVSYITLQTMVSGNFPEVQQYDYFFSFWRPDHHGYTDVYRHLECLREYWRNGWANLHTLPQDEMRFRKYLMLFKECRWVGLGLQTPLRSLEQLWNAWEPFMANIYSIAVHTEIGVNLTKVVDWLIGLSSPLFVNRCLCIRWGSLESYHLVFAIRDAFHKLRTPLSYRVTLIVWNIFTQWPITNDQKYDLLAATTPLHAPLESEHNVFEFMMYGPYGLHHPHRASSTIRIRPK